MFIAFQKQVSLLPLWKTATQTRTMLSHIYTAHMYDYNVATQELDQLK